MSYFQYLLSWVAKSPCPLLSTEGIYQEIRRYLPRDATFGVTSSIAFSCWSLSRKSKFEKICWMKIMLITPWTARYSQTCCWYLELIGCPCRPEFFRSIYRGWVVISVRRLATLADLWRVHYKYRRWITHALVDSSTYQIHETEVGWCHCCLLCQISWCQMSHMISNTVRSVVQWKNMK